MAKEIERKYLVRDMCFKESAISSERMVQAYLSKAREATVRVRISGERAWLTVKGENSGAVRDEWEYQIPVADARGMLACCSGGYIDKTRYRVPFSNMLWEVDCFHGALEGLVVAEIELPSEDTEFVLPPFVGKEVTGDPRYYNSSLIGSSQAPAETGGE